MQTARSTANIPTETCQAGASEQKNPEPTPASKACQLALRLLQCDLTKHLKDFSVISMLPFINKEQANAFSSTLLGNTVAACNSRSAEKLPSAAQLSHCYAHNWTPESLKDPANRKVFNALLSQLSETAGSLRAEHKTQDANKFSMLCDELDRDPADRQKVLKYGKSWSEVENQVNRNGLILRELSDQFRSDPDIVLAAVKTSSFTLKEACQALRDNAEIVKAAVGKDHWALNEASERLKNDAEVVMAAIAKDPFALEYASEAIRDNFDVVMAAVKKSGFALEFASERLRNNLDIVMAATKQDDRSLEYASQETENHPAIVAYLEKQAQRLANQYKTPVHHNNHHRRFSI